MQPADQSENIIKIQNPERVERILSRAISAKLELLMRLESNMKLAVRGKAQLIDTGTSPTSILIDGLSDKGARYLAQSQEVRVEFVGMATQIVFYVTCRGVTADTVRLDMPKEIHSFDRRVNTRAVVTAKLAAFIRLTTWRPRSSDITAPPVLDLYSDLANQVALVDVSEGGVCGITRFPHIVDTLDRGHMDPKAEIILPLATPIVAPIEVRWTRRIKESRIMPDGSTRNQRSYRVGFQFTNPDEALKLQLKQYMNQLTVADAI
jgi:hypothetical protein